MVKLFLNHFWYWLYCMSYRYQYSENDNDLHSVRIHMWPVSIVFPQSLLWVYIHCFELSSLSLFIFKSYRNPISTIIMTTLNILALLYIGGLGTFYLKILIAYIRLRICCTIIPLAIQVLFSFVSFRSSIIVLNWRIASSFYKIHHQTYFF